MHSGEHFYALNQNLLGGTLVDSSSSFYKIEACLRDGRQHGFREIGGNYITTHT